MHATGPKALFLALSDGSILETDRTGGAGVARPLPALTASPPRRAFAPLPAAAPPTRSCA